MDVKIPYSQITDKKQGFEAAKKLLPEVISKFNVKADVQFDEALHTIKAKGSGFEANVKFDETDVIVSVDLGLLLKPFKSKIVETIEKQIKKVV